MISWLGSTLGRRAYESVHGREFVLSDPAPLTEGQYRTLAVLARRRDQGCRVGKNPTASVVNWRSARSLVERGYAYESEVYDAFGDGDRTCMWVHITRAGLQALNRSVR
jgi:hypothetical protein